jgi:hypothetical protein
MAALRNLDGGQRSTGFVYMTAFGVTQDHAQALRWLPLAAATESPSVFAAFPSGGCCAASIPTTTMHMHAMQMGNRGASDAAQVDGSARCVRCFLLQLSIYQTPYVHKNKQINKSHERDIPNMV